jgi:sortase A
MMTIRIQWRSACGHRVLGWLQAGFFLAGCLALGFCALAYLDARFYQAVAERWFNDAAPPGFENGFEALKGRIAVRPVPALRALAHEGSPLSRMEIPRLGLSVMVAEGVQARTLTRAVGHIPGTAFPDEAGNVGIAGHRDTFFRSLKQIAENDVITLTTLSGSYRYAVEWTRVVGPREVAVLDASANPVLTLVTCYPFYYAGPAPKRFIVRARRISPRDF